MAATLLLDRAQWDLTLDAQGNIALATEPYSLSQDAASAIRTFLGECYFDTTVGVPWLTQILSRRPSLALLKAQLAAAAKTVSNVASAQVFISAFTPDRIIEGQVQVTAASTGQTSAANFSVTDPQGGNPTPVPPQPPQPGGGTQVFIPTVLTGI